MNEYNFTLKFSLANTLDDPEQYVHALAEQGCDDAIIGIGQAGRIALHFTRVAGSALNAVSSAIQNVKSAIPDAVLIESAPDYVGLTDIASILGFSRQYIRKLMINNHNFPHPLHTGKTEIWNLSEFLAWYEVNQNKPIEQALKDIAYVNQQVNLSKTALQIDEVMQKKLASL